MGGGGGRDGGDGVLQSGGHDGSGVAGGFLGEKREMRTLCPRRTGQGEQGRTSRHPRPVRFDANAVQI